MYLAEQITEYKVYRCLIKQKLRELTQKKVFDKRVSVIYIYIYIYIYIFKYIYIYLNIYIYIYIYIYITDTLLSKTFF